MKAGYVKKAALLLWAGTCVAGFAQAEQKLNVPYGVQKLSADLPGLSISTVGSAHSANSINANILRQSSIVSDATHQYTAYYDASGMVVSSESNRNN